MPDSDLSGRRYWLVGASSGLGRALAEALAEEGVSLLLSARSADELDDLAARLPGAGALPMDVTQPESVKRAAREAGTIDGVIYCAGAYWPMSVHDWDTDKLEIMTETNYTGALRVLGHLLPGFLERDEGHIVLIGSLAGFRGLPSAQGYGPSKAALMRLGETLYGELRESGVTVTLANPGFIRTRLSDKNDFDMPQIMEPEVAAAKVVKAMKSRRLQKTFPAPFAWLFTAGRLLPDSVFYRIFK